MHQRSETLFTSALGLQPPWAVQDVKLNTAARRIDFASVREAVPLSCPACGVLDQPVHDRLHHSWCHLDFFRYKA